MAELLRVNGIAVPVLVDGAEEKPRSIGEDDFAEDGTILISRRTIKMDYAVKVAHQSPTDGVAWRKLLSGEGETWSFDTSLYGSKGSKPSAATGATQDATSPKYGAGVCRLSATTGTISYATLPANGAKWTVMVWRKIGAGAWVHYVVTSASKAGSQAYVDGVLASNATAWLTVTTATGTVKLDADAASNTYLDDLVILPFDVPSAWPADVVAYGAAFSPLGKLKVDGDLIDANLETKTVVPRVNGSKVVPAYLNGVYYQAIRALDVELREG